MDNRTLDAFRDELEKLAVSGLAKEVLKETFQVGKNLVTSPRAALKEGVTYASKMSLPGKAMVGGGIALDAKFSSADKDERGRKIGKGERIGRTIGSVGTNIATIPAGIVPGILFGIAGGEAGAKAGKLVDKALAKEKTKKASSPTVFLRRIKPKPVPHGMPDFVNPAVGIATKKEDIEEALESERPQKKRKPSLPK